MKLHYTYLNSSSNFIDQLISSVDLRCILINHLKILLQQTNQALITSTEQGSNLATFLNTLKNHPQIYRSTMSRQFIADSSADIEFSSLADQFKDWFIRTADFGDDCDRVLQHRDSEYTQLLKDLAYYHQVFQEGCDRVIVLRPPAYKGYDIQLTAAMKALGYTAEQFQFIVVEPIKLYAFHVPSQRITPIPDISSEELIQAIGMDALRWHSFRVPLTSVAPINISTAGQATPEDSLYQVQSAHARCCALLRQAHKQNIIKLNTSNQNNWTISSTSISFSKFSWESPLARNLASQLQTVPQVLSQSATEVAPHLIVRHLEATSQICHQWLSSISLNQQNCALLLATKQMIFELLESILTIQAPETIGAK